MELSGVSGPFLVLSLPRSRSAWMAHYLRYGTASVGHDTLVECDSVAQFLGQFQGDNPLIGSCETGAMLGWRLLRKCLPGARIVVVRRDPGEVAVSLAKAGMPVDSRELESRAAMLDLLAGQSENLVLDYQDLATPAGCGALFEFCLLQPFDYGWWDGLRNINIQLDMAARLSRLRERSRILEGFKQEVVNMTKEAGPCGLH